MLKPTSSVKENRRTFRRDIQEGKDTVLLSKIQTEKGLKWRICVVGTEALKT